MRQCEACGAPFEPVGRAIYCKSPECATERARERQRAKRGPSNVVPVQFGSSGLVEQVRAELIAADRLNSSAGQSALALADRIENHSGKDTGSAYAALHRELNAAMERATASARVEGPVDELRMRRLAIRDGA